jgi:hypothetical protein
MNREHVTAGPVKPCHDDDLVTNGDPVDRIDQRWTDFEPGIGRALVALFRRHRTRLQSRADDADRAEPQRVTTWLSNHVCPAVDFAQSPATCLVVTLSRFQTLMRAIERTNAASACSS